jgi:thiosulfate reductase cytochrome b subunit
MEDKTRHPGFVRWTHWVTALAFAALLVTGIEIVISHPRFYWGEAGNVTMKPLFTLPIPASRGSVPTGYGYVLPDQNGWSRSLHFEAAWAVFFAALVYGGLGFAKRHFQTKLWPGDGLSWNALREELVRHARFERPGAAYNLLQRLSYLAVVFVLFPLMFWTGLAMSPAVVAVAPFLAAAVGGQQSARTVHFVVTGLLTAFVIVHVVMVYRAGFWSRVRAMVIGQADEEKSA